MSPQAASPSWRSVSEIGGEPLTKALNLLRFGAFSFLALFVPILSDCPYLAVLWLQNGNKNNLTLKKNTYRLAEKESFLPPLRLQVP